MSRLSSKDHAFVVCAYKRSPFLRECVESLMAQTVRTRVVVATSTPNELISQVCDEYSLDLRVGSHEPGIARDWNFALESADASFVTIAHQDDVYKPDYAQRALAALGSMRHPLIYFTNYSELRDGREVEENRLLEVKRAMLWPLRDGRLCGSRLVRRRVLSLGDPICCPSVTYSLDNLDRPVFCEGFRGSLDWQAWERASRLEGGFYYDSKILMSHRIHEGSETSALIGDTLRTKEDLEMYRRFWPSPIAHMLSGLYAKSQKSNKLS